MRRKVIRWWFLTAALLVNLSGPGMANGVGAIDAISTAGVRVAEVEVRGNQQISRDAILAVVTARPGRMITREDLTRDMERLRSLGYFQSVGTPEVESTPSGARITYVVEEYPRVAGVRFEGNTALTDAELDQIIGVERGQLLNLERCRPGCAPSKTATARVATWPGWARSVSAPRELSPSQSRRCASPRWRSRACVAFARRWWSARWA